jgi:hypothetical protein
MKPGDPIFFDEDFKRSYIELLPPKGQDKQAGLFLENTKNKIPDS